jgi:hypothetical protein
MNAHRGQNVVGIVDRIGLPRQGERALMRKVEWLPLTTQALMEKSPIWIGPLKK